MKYSSMFSRFSNLILGLLICSLLASCAGSATKLDKSSEESELALRSSKEYLPVRQYDKEGNQQVFTAMSNPYGETKRRIDKQVIVDFIAARKAYRDQRYDQAKSLLDGIVQADQNLSGPWVMLGHLALQKKNTDQAEENLNKAISVNKLNINAYIPLAKIYRQKGDYIRAQNTYVDALRIWKDFPEAHLNLGILYDIYLNDPLQAQQHMEAYDFLTDYQDETVEKWLAEIRSRTGIEANLYIGPPSVSQNEGSEGDNS